MVWLTAAGSLQKKTTKKTKKKTNKNCDVDSSRGIICSNVERKNKFKRFEGAVSKTFIVASHQIAIKHLQEVGSFVDCPGAEVFGFLACGLFWSKNLHTQ